MREVADDCVVAFGRLTPSTTAASSASTTTWPGWPSSATAASSARRPSRTATRPWPTSPRGARRSKPSAVALVVLIQELSQVLRRELVAPVSGRPDQVEAFVHPSDLEEMHTKVVSSVVVPMVQGPLVQGFRLLFAAFELAVSAPSRRTDPASSSRPSRSSTDARYTKASADPEPIASRNTASASSRRPHPAEALPGQRGPPGLRLVTPP